MLTRKRALVEVDANDSRAPKPAKRPNRDPENASEAPPSREKRTEAPFTSGPAHVSIQSVFAGGLAPQHAYNQMHKEVSILQLQYVTCPKPSYSVDPEDIEIEKEKQPTAEEEERYDGKPAEEFPDWPYVISKATAELVTKYSLESTKRNQDVFSMYVSNDFTGYGMQEVVENQLTGINTLMAKRQFPADELAVGLWVRLSAFAHWTQSQELGPWIMMDDGERWEDTVAMIGIATLATLNSLDRAKLLKKHSPIKDLDLVLALLGDFICDCLDQITTVPYLSSNTREGCWPYKIVSYAKANNIKIEGVHGIEGKFVQRFDNEDKANYWKRKECVDRWGWGTKWRIFSGKYGKQRSICYRGPSLGGNAFDITSWPAAERTKYHFEDKDALEFKTL